jgi:hypothetical protein
MPAHSCARRGRWWRLGAAVTVAVAWFAAPAGVGAPGGASAAGRPTIVLEHGAWADATSLDLGSRLAQIHRGGQEPRTDDATVMPATHRTH